MFALLAESSFCLLLHGVYALQMKPFGSDTTPWLVIAMPGFEAMESALCAANIAEPCRVSWERFPDDTPNISFNAAAVEGRDVLLLGSPDPQRHLDFFSIVFSIPRYLARSFVVLMPYFATGTMERVEREGEIATAKTLARIMSATPSPQFGQTTFVIFDMHALATRFFFSDRIKVLLPSAVPEAFPRVVRRILEREGPTVKLAVCFPDEGAKKRFARFFSLPVVLCGKHRAGDARRVIIQEGAVQGHHVVIVDDLVQSGGTLAACRDALFAEGAAGVSAYVTHGVFPNKSWTRFLVDERGTELSSAKRGFDHFFVTDSIPWVAVELACKRPFCVLPLHDSVSHLLTKGHARSRL